jgi:hypothetical protein
MISLIAQASYSLNTTIQHDPSNLSAFGTLENAELTPIIQFDFQHGINSQQGTTNGGNGGTVTTANGLLRIQAGTAANGNAIFKSFRPVRYRAGQGTTARFTTVFTAAGTNNLQTIGAGNEQDGYFFGVTNNTYGIVYRNNSVDTWIPYSTWNGSNNLTAAGYTPQWTNGIVCMIKYPYLGFGNIGFYIEDQTTSRFILVHTIRYTGSTNVLQLSNPNLSFYAESKTYAGGGTNVALCGVGSVGFFLSGPRSFVSNPKWSAISGYKSGITTTETAFISLKNCTNYNGIINRSLVRLNSIGFSGTPSGNNTAANISLRINATLGGTPVFNGVNGTTNQLGGVITGGNSVVSFDVAATTVTGGTLIFCVPATAGNTGNGTTTLFDLSPYDIFIGPGDVLTISGLAGNGTFQGVVTVTWTEDI